MAQRLLLYCYLSLTFIILLGGASIDTHAQMYDNKATTATPTTLPQHSTENTKGKFYAIMYPIIEKSIIETHSITGTSNFDIQVNPIADPEAVYCFDHCSVDPKLYAWLHIGGEKRTYEQGNLTCSCTITVQIEGSTDGVNWSSIGSSFTMQVNGNYPDEVRIIDVSDFYDLSCTEHQENYTHFRAHITSVTLPNGANAPYTFELLFHDTPQIDISSDPTYQLFGSVIDGSIMLCADIATGMHRVNTNPVTFEWFNPYCADSIPNFQFQLLRLYNIDPTATDEESIHTKVKWSQALNLETGGSKQQLTLTIAEGKGYYAWRVRPIGNKYPGGITNPENWGTWLSHPSDGEYDIDVCSSSLEHVFFYNPEPVNSADDIHRNWDKNWSFERAFSESDGYSPRISESMVFSDALARPTQAQGSSYSENAILLNQTVYDNSGRASLQTLRAPDVFALPNTPFLAYRNQFFTAGSTPVLYTAQNYDLSTKIDNPDPASNSSSLPDYNVNSYYSDNNPNTQIPSANDYPFARTTYYPDGRPYKSSGVGYDHKFASAFFSNTERTTNTYYARVSEKEVVDMFGQDAPNPDKCYKVITKSPDQVTSAAYFNNEGQLIATCMVDNGEITSIESGTIAADGTGTLLNLTGEKVISSTNSIDLSFNTIPIQRIDENTFMSSAELLFTKTTAITWGGYSFTGKGPQNIDCPEICYNCDYTVKIRIIEVQTGDVKYESDEDTFTGSEINCGQSAFVPTTLFSDLPTELPAGLYRVERYIRTNNLLGKTSEAHPPTTANEATTSTEEYFVERVMKDILPLDEVIATVLGSYEEGPSQLTEDEHYAYYREYRSNTSNNGAVSIDKTTPHENCKNIWVQDVKCNDDQPCDRDFEKYLISAIAPLIPNKAKFPLDYEVEDRQGTDVQWWEHELYVKTLTLSDLFVDINGNNKFGNVTGSNFSSCTTCFTSTELINSKTWGLLNAIVERMRCEDLSGTCKDDIDFDCKKLWSCWVQTVDAYKYLLDRKIKAENSSPLNRGNIVRVGLADPNKAPYFDFLETFLSRLSNMDGTGTNRLYTKIVNLDDPKPVDWACEYLDSYKTIFIKGNTPAHETCIKCNKPTECASYTTVGDIITCINSSSGCKKESIKKIAGCLPENSIDRGTVDNNKGIKDNKDMQDLLAEQCTLASDFKNYLSFVECLQKQVTKLENTCVFKCEGRRKEFENQVRDYYHHGFNSHPWYVENDIRPDGTVAEYSLTSTDVIRLEKFNCHVENLIRDCSAGCDLGFNSANVIDMLEEAESNYPQLCPNNNVLLKAMFDDTKVAKFQSHFVGYPEIRIRDDYHNTFRCITDEDYHCPISDEESHAYDPAFNEVCDEGGTQILDILIPRLNKRYKELYDAGIQSGDVLHWSGRYFTTNFADDVASIIRDLEDIYSMTIDVPSCFSTYYSLIIPNKEKIFPFDKKWKFSRTNASLNHYTSTEQACNTSSCRLYLTHIQPVGPPIVTFEQHLNTYLDNVWGKLLPGLTPTDTVSSSVVIDTATTVTILHGVMPSVSYDSLEYVTNRLLDSATYYSFFGRTDTTAAFFRLPDSVPYPKDVVDGFVASHFTDVLALRTATSSPDSIWKAFGTIVVQLPRASSNDPPMRLTIRLTRATADSGLLVSLKLVKTDFSSNDTTQEIVLPITIYDLYQHKFTDVIGKFVINNGLLQFEKKWTEYYTVQSGMYPQSLWQELESNEDYAEYYGGEWNTSLGTIKSENYTNITTEVSGSCNISSLCTPVYCGICVRWVLPSANIADDDVETFSPTPCKGKVLEIVRSALIDEYNRKVAELVSKARKSFKDNCILSALSGATETFSATYTPNALYHFTLYYYDHAGNLLKTIPPKGFNFASTKSRSTDPAHTMASTYKYDIYNRPIESTTPDGGTTKYWYNSKGQLRFTQDARQAAVNRYSYIKYDEYGRTKETGEEWTNPTLTAANLDNSTGFPSTSGKDFTLIYYSTPYTPAGTQQRNLRNNVSYAEHYTTTGSTNITSTTYYSYDEHGNVEWATQRIPELANTTGDDGDCRFDYEYDLISGNINKISYRKGFNDQFFHRYVYDKDNRLLYVETSRDDVIWDRDASYSYYPHGPLRRVVIGEDSVQGIDYVYTIHGWLKAINHPSLTAAKDPGEDGANGSTTPPQTIVAADAFGSMLHYYNNTASNATTGLDFYHNGSDFNSNAAGNLPPDYGLFGGGISAWSYRTIDPNNDPNNNSMRYEPELTGEELRYDVLGRLRYSDFRHYTTSWQTSSDDYSSTYKYDANGNITDLTRNWLPTWNGTTTTFDDQTFVYSSGNNRLERVDDNAADGALPGLPSLDINDQPNSAPNYTYDASGNLVKDEQEGFVDGSNAGIIWNHTGVVSEVKRGSDITTFTYDADNNRIVKETPNEEQEIIVYDPLSGAPAARYSREQTEAPVLKELTIYGAGRLGVMRPSDNTDRAAYTQAFADRRLGEKLYELTDHLGNVRAVITDRKLVYGSSFIAEVKTISNYFPFGMEQPGRTWLSNGTNYTYGYNGMERDDDLKLQGNSYTTPFRMNDPRLAGRWWSTDPITKPWESPYAGYGNNPVSFIDPMGLEQTQAPTQDNNNTQVDQNGYDITITGYVTIWDKIKWALEDAGSWLAEGGGKIGVFNNGFNNAHFSNQILGLGRNDSPYRTTIYRAGQTTADVLDTFQGVVETLGGAALIGGSVVGGAAAEFASGGTATPAVIIAAPAGVTLGSALVVHGAAVAYTAGNNFSNDISEMYSESNSREDQGRSGGFNEAKEKGDLPKSQQPKPGYPKKERVRDQTGKYVEGRVYEMERKRDGATVTIKEHSLGHDDANPGDPARKPHFNTEVKSKEGKTLPLKSRKGTPPDSHSTFKTKKK